MRYARWLASGTLPLVLLGCSDTATFVTGTSIGLAASAETRQVQIGYSRAELFQGPNYPDVGEAPAVAGFFGSDLQVFSPHIRQLYATGDAAGLVTTPVALEPCPPDGRGSADAPPNLCAERANTLSGERRILVFGTGTSLGLKLGFTGDAPSSIDFGYDREELSVIPMHKQAPSGDSNKPDKYSSVLASVDVNLATPNFLGTDLKLTQFFATGAAARNLAKNPDIQSYFKRVATGTVDPAKAKSITDILTRDQKAIDAYFGAKTDGDFSNARDKLLKDPQLAGIFNSMPDELKTATTLAAFDSVLQANGTLIHPIASVAQRLNPSGAPN